MALMAISIAPSGSNETSLSTFVAEVIKIAKEDDRVTIELGSMFTTIEGELDVCFEVARRMHERMAELGAKRISTVIKIDDRRDKAATIEGKKASVQAKLME